MHETSSKGLLYGETADFWLFGGLSIVIWLGLTLLYMTGQQAQPAFLSLAVQMSGFFAIAGLLVNTPHFYWSYRIAYGQGADFLLRNAFQLILVPLALIAIMALAFLCTQFPEVDAKVSGGLNQALSWFALDSHAAFYKNSGACLIGLLLVAQYTAVGWHYSKQVFGISVLSSVAARYPLSRPQILGLKFQLFAIWAIYLCEVNAGYKIYHFGGFAYQNMNWPVNLTLVTPCILVGLIFYNLYFIVWKNWANARKLPPWPTVAPVLALHLWYIPAIYLRTPGFFEWVVPFFHSIQYLSFTSRYEINKETQAREKADGTSGSWVYAYILVVFCGFLFSHWLPPTLDSQLSAAASGTVSVPAFFAIATYLFINIHHYFIDNAIWRKSNPEVRTVLLAHANHRSRDVVAPSVIGEPAIA